MGRGRHSGRGRGRVYLAIMIAAGIAFLGLYALMGFGGNEPRLPDLGEAPDFRLRTINGEVISLKDLRGKPVILWFMAAWCPSCVGQAQALKEVEEILGDRVAIVAIDLWVRDVIGEEQGGIPAEDIDDLIRFKERYGSNGWIWTLDTDKAVIKYGITAVDSTVIVSPEGRIVFKRMGPTGAEPLLEVLEKILKLGSSGLADGDQSYLYPRGCGCL